MTEGLSLEERIAATIEAYSAQGDHRTGTAVDEQSARWLAAELEQIGVDASLDAFPLDRLTVNQAALMLGDEALEGVPLYDCTYTGEQGVRAALGEPGTLGTIGLLELTEFGGGDGTARLRALRRSDHVGLIVMVRSQGSDAGPAVLNAESFREPYGVPVLQLPHQLAPRLRAVAASGQPVRLVAHCGRERARAFNVQARIEGRDRNAPPLVVMTPRSGWWRCASERGGGIAAFLEIARTFSTSKPSRPVILTANSGHELSHLGLDHYLEQHPGLIEQAHAWIHLGANFAAADAPVLMQYSDAELENLAQRSLTQHRLHPDQVTPIGQRPLGEARNVFDGGGRYVSLLGGNPLFHHPDDRWPDAVDLAKVISWTGMMVSVAQMLSA